MSDSEDSIISYTVVSSPYGGLSNIGSPGVYGPPVMPEDPYTYVVAAFHASPSPDYVPGPEYPPSPEFVPEPVYPEFMPAEDDIRPTEEQPLPAAALLTTESLGYIDESDPEDDPEEDPKDDPEEDLVDYPAEGGEEDEEEDEYLAPADSKAVALPAIDHAPSAEETEPFETDKSAATPPPHPAYRIPLPPLPLLSLPPIDPTYEEAPLGYRAARLRWKAEREEIPKADLPLQKRLCTAHTGTYELGESSASAAARHREPVRDDLHRFVDIVERGEGSTPATMEAIGRPDYDGRLREEIPEADLPLQKRFVDTIERGEGSTPAAIEVGYGITDTWDDLGVARALATCDADRNTNGDDSHNLRTDARRTKRVTRECTYPDFMRCKPMNFKGTEGVVELTQWFKKMETVFRISNYSVENQIKFSTCTLLGSALTWWNSHVMTVGPAATYAMTWVDIKKKMTDMYCPMGEMKNLKSELWNLRVKSNDLGSYNQRFQELALLCVRMFLEEADKSERYVGGLPDVIHRNVVASRPKTIQEAIEMVNELIDKKNNSWAERQAENKRKVDSGRIVQS
nr:reverse transcriptase domain-containing protein [Tanacetum cinerariifolium]